jgi:hypothetical protein
MPAGDITEITECRYISYADQQRYLDDGWTLIPQSGPHAAYGVIASRPIPDSNHGPQTLSPHP